ncbi:glycosyltransferase family 39 protein [Candidatus Babeliales bacterium]|nr:glycosyltransferase family 39 protein [Candidatus Babeliales bacterium]
MEKKRLFFSVFIFVSILAILALPFFNWGFINDDCGFLLHAQLHKLSDLFSFFAPHDIGHAFNPSNYPAIPLTFASVLYRPMQFVLFGLESWFFGINPYALLICVITLHALISVVLFNIFFTFFGLPLAFFGAMFFALHPSLEHWIGVFTCQIYIVDVLYLLGAAYCLKRYLDSKKCLWYLLSCSIMTLSIFAKETLIVFPVWAFAATMFYCSFTQGGALWQYAGRALRVSLGYWAGAFFYLVVRLWLFPLQIKVLGGNFKQTFDVFVARQKERLGDWISYVCDYLYVGLIPSGNRLLKGSLVVLLLSCLVWPFFARRQYKELCFLVGSIILFTWPALLLYYQPRYLYVGLPFLFGIILYAVSYYTSRFSVPAWGLYPFLFILLAVNATSFFYRQRTKERVLNTIITAFKGLVADQKIHDRAVWFVGLPMHWFGSSNAQALWLLGGSAKRMSVFYTINTFAFKSEPFYEIKPHHMTVELKNGMVELRSCDPEHLYFPKNISTQNSVSSLTVLEKNSRGEPTAISIVIEALLKKDNPVLVSWDYQLQKFLIV